MQGFPNLDNGNGKGYNKYKTLLSSIKKLRIRNMSHLKVKHIIFTLSVHSESANMSMMKHYG